MSHHIHTISHYITHKEVCTHNEPSHHPQWGVTSPTMSQHITHNEKLHPPQWAITSPTMSHHITHNEPLHHPQWAITSPTMSHHIPTISHHITHNEVSHLPQWAIISPTMSHHIPTMSHHIPTMSHHIQHLHCFKSDVSPPSFTPLTAWMFLIFSAPLHRWDSNYRILYKFSPHTCFEEKGLARYTPTVKS